MDAVRITMCAMGSRVGDVEGNLSEIMRRCDEADAAEADLVCLPELCLPGYSMPASRGLAMDADDGNIGAILDRSSSSGLSICFGYVDSDGCIAQSIVEDGRIAGTYRKTHLGEREAGVMTPGDGLPVFRLRKAVVGISICWEAHFPEIAGTLALEGADLVLMPFASGLGGARRQSSWDRVLPARAYDNTVFVAACNACGDNGAGVTLGGGAAVYDVRGRRVACGEGACTVTADLDPSEMESIRSGGGPSMRDVYFLDKRRPELYGRLSGRLRRPPVPGNLRKFTVWHIVFNWIRACTCMDACVGRSSELGFLEDLWGKVPVSCAVCGRRHLGKTSLLKEFTKDKRHIYITGTAGLSLDNLDEINSALTGLAGADRRISDIRDLFPTIKKIAGNEKTVVVIDRFSDLVDNFSDIVTYMRTFVNRDMGGTRIMLVVCDSDSSVFGRFYYTLDLKPLSYIDCKGFHPGYTPLQHLYAYAIAGGVPAYQGLFGQEDPMDVVREQMFDHMSVFSLEAESMAYSEVLGRSGSTRVLVALARGAETVRDISAQTGLPSGTCTKAVDDLENRGLVSKEVSAGATRRTAYQIRSNLLAFYHQVVYRHTHMVEFESGADAYEAAVGDIRGYMEGKFKEVCMDYISHHLDYNYVGRLRRRDDSLDDVMDFLASFSHDKSDGVLVARCRLSGEALGEGELDALRERAKKVEGREKVYALFSGCGFTPELEAVAANNESVRLLTIADVYAS